MSRSAGELGKVSRRQSKVAIVKKNLLEADFGSVSLKEVKYIFILISSSVGITR